MNPTNSILYEVTYESNGFIQIKGLVSDEDYINILKPIKKAINIIEDSNKGKPNRQSELLKQSLGIMFGDYNECITQSSPMGLSLKSELYLYQNIKVEIMLLNGKK